MTRLLCCIILSTTVSVVHAGLDSGLVAYWPFDGTALDAGPSALHGTIDQAVPSADRSGRAATALEFDGSNDNVVVADAAALRIQAPLTLSGWVYMSGSQPHNARILMKEYSSSQPYASYGLEVNWGGHSEFAMIVSTSTEGHGALRSNVVHTSGRWYHVAGTYDGSQMRLYVNGQLDASMQHGGTIVYNDWALDMGGDVPRNLEYLDGSLDDIRIYNRVLSDEEILLLYDSYAGDHSYYTADAHTVALWRFDAGAGRTLVDWSGNGNHGEMQGSPAWVASENGLAAVFDGLEDYIVVPHSASLVGMNQLTIEGLVYNNDTEGNGVIVDKRRTGSYNDDCYLVEIQPDARVAAIISDGTPNYSTRFSRGPLQRGDWHTFQLVYDGDSLFFLFDGQRDTVYDVANIAIHDYDAPLLIGKTMYPDGHEWDGWFDGRIDELRISNVARAPDGGTTSGAPVVIPVVPDPTADRTPAFVWRSMTGATNYKLQVSSSPAFEDVLLEAYTGGDTVCVPDSSLPLGVLYWRVSSNLDYALHSAVDSFTIYSPQMRPRLIPYPYDSTTDRAFAISWQQVDSAGSYFVTVSTNPELTDPIVSNAQVAALRFVPQSAYPYGPLYYHVSTDLAPGICSSTGMTVVVPFHAPTLTSPPEMAPVDTSASLCWSAVHDPSSVVHYEIQVSTTDNFTGAALGDTGISEACFPLRSLSEDLPSSALMFWRVRATNDWGMHSAWSMTGSFSLRPSASDHSSHPTPQTDMVRLAGRTESGPAVRVFVAEDGALSVTVYDLAGHVLKRTVQSAAAKGWHTVPLPDHLRHFGTVLMVVETRTGTTMERALLHP